MLFLPSSVNRCGGPTPLRPSTAATYRSLRFPAFTNPRCLLSELRLRSDSDNPAQFVIRRGLPIAFAADESTRSSHKFVSLSFGGGSSTESVIRPSEDQPKLRTPGMERIVVSIPPVRVTVSMVAFGLAPSGRDFRVAIRSPAGDH